MGRIVQGMSSHEPEQIRVLRARVRELERANHQLIVHDIARKHILDFTVKLLAQAIDERNHWYRKVVGNDGFTNRD